MVSSFVVFSLSIQESMGYTENGLLNVVMLDNSQDQFEVGIVIEKFLLCRQLLIQPHCIIDA